jgi:hypothetical protein
LWRPNARSLFRLDIIEYTNNSQKAQRIPRVR